MSRAHLKAMEAAAGTAAMGVVDRAVLVGLARWAAELTVGRAEAVALVGGMRTVPRGASEIAAPEGLVVLAAPEITFAAIGAGDVAHWSSRGAAVRAVVELLELPEGSRSTVERALRCAPPESASLIPIIEAIGEAVAHERHALASRLHDGPVQELTVAVLLLDGPHGGRAADEQGLTALRAAAASCRALMGALTEPERGS